MEASGYTPPAMLNLTGTGDQGIAAAVVVVIGISLIRLSLEDLASAKSNLSKAEEILEREGIETGLEDR